MRPVDLARAHPLGAALAIGALLGVLIGALRTVEVDAGAAAAAAPWRLPAPESLTRGDERYLAQLRQAEIWGATGSAAGGGRATRGGRAAAAETWRLLGIVTRPEPLALVLNEAAGQVDRIGVGETLPDGGKLLEIGDTLIRFERQGCRYQRRLFAPVAEPDDGDCGGPGAASNPPNDAPDPDR